MYIADGIESLTCQYLCVQSTGLSMIGYKSKIQSVRFSNTLKVIGTRVFHGMPQYVRYLVIPKSVEKIETDTVYKYCYDHKDYDHPNFTSVPVSGDGPEDWVWSKNTLQ